MAARRALLLRLPLEDAQRLEILATRRNTTAAELAELVVVTWIDGPGRHELVDALLRPRRSPRRTTARSPGPGQLQLLTPAE